MRIPYGLQNKIRIIRIISVHHMGGTNNEIKGNFFQKIRKKILQDEAEVQARSRN